MEIDSAKINKIAQKYNIKMLLLFGSRAKKSFKKESDFDVAYSTENILSLEVENNLSFDLSFIFKSENIDLVNLRKASPLMLKQVAENSVILYQENKSVFNEFFLYAINIYNEAKVLFKMREEYLSRKIASY